MLTIIFDNLFKIVENKTKLKPDYKLVEIDQYERGLL